MKFLPVILFVCFFFFYKLQPAACRLHTENVICDYFLLSHLWIHTLVIYMYIYIFFFLIFCLDYKEMSRLEQNSHVIFQSCRTFPSKCLTLLWFYVHTLLVALGFLKNVLSFLFVSEKKVHVSLS